MRKQSVAELVFLGAVLLGAIQATAKEPQSVITWPEKGQPVVRLTFGRFDHIGGVGKTATYNTEVIAENLWNKPIENLSFTVRFYDKTKTRIGESYLSLRGVPVGQKVKQELTIATQGQPISLDITAEVLPKELGPSKPARQVAMQVQSMPTGATLTVDGEPAGTTPKTVHLSPGQHKLEFSKEGFRTGTYPLEIGPDDTGGSINIELGGLSHDTIELRDGTVITGDVETVSATSVEVRVAGKIQTIERNQVRKIFLVEREPPVVK
jgi:hypothetical protein